MITFSAFADEIGDDLKLQMDTCESCGVKCIDVRGIDGKNVSGMSIAEAGEYNKQLEDRGFSVPCIGSPIGKIRMDEDFDAHLELLKHCFDVGKAFGTDRIRIFSFYASEGKNITDERDGVMERMRAMVQAAESADFLLLHENEHAIYGAKPDGIKDLFATIQSDHFKGIFDPANFVVEGIPAYDECWTQGLGELTFQLHVKDKRPDDEACVPAGEGNGQFREIFADLKKREWSGYATLEPHLAAAGQFGGVTGAELFPKAVDALRALCEEAGLAYQ